MNIGHKGDIPVCPVLQQLRQYEDCAERYSDSTQTYAGSLLIHRSLAESDGRLRNFDRGWHVDAM